MKDVQIIERDGKPEWAVLPYEEYLSLLEESQLLEDIRDYDALRAAVEGEEEKTIPAEIVNALLDGENPVRVWRKHREMTQQELADEAGISKPYLSQIENGHRTGTTEILTNLARALRVGLEDMFPMAANPGR
jgi:DNA-binding XRE family transcriptional regulator